MNESRTTDKAKREHQGQTFRSAPQNVSSKVQSAFGDLLHPGCTPVSKPKPIEWKTAELSPPEQRGDVRNWLQTIGLQSLDDYLLDPRLRFIKMGLGWDKVADVDASAVTFDANLNVIEPIWFKRLKSSDGSIIHSGDNLTGIGSGDDETITVSLNSLPHRVHHILFAVCVYSYDLSFLDVRRAYVRMMNNDVQHKHREICRFELQNMSGHAMLMAQLTRKGSYWNFRALGIPATGRTITTLLKDPTLLTHLNKSPSFSPIFRRITVCVVEGKNLAAKDDPGIMRRVASSDPYFIIRYREESYTSEYKSQTLNPEWKLVSFDMGLVTDTDHFPLQINVFDYDSLSTDDFMGEIIIPASSLYNLGTGKHAFAFELAPSKEPAFKHESVSGELHICVTVTQVDFNGDPLHEHHLLPDGQVDSTTPYKEMSNRKDEEESLRSVILNQFEERLLESRTRSIQAGLGWAEVCDLDLSVILLNKKLTVVDKVWFARLHSTCDSVVLSRDERTGKQRDADEVVNINLDILPLEVHHLAFIVSVHSLDKALHHVKDAFFRLQDAEQSGENLFEIQLKGTRASSLVMAQLTRKKSLWMFKALGEPVEGRDVAQILRRPRNLDCLANCPSISPIVCEIEILVTGASNLVAKDAATFWRKPTSDPYYVIRYNKREHTSRHVRSTLSPKWNELAFNLGRVSENSDEIIEIEVFDYDFCKKDDFMGTVTYSVGQLCTYKNGRTKLNPKLTKSTKEKYRDEKVDGVLHITCISREITLDG